MNQKEMFESTLAFIAEVLDAKYQECDDGYVLCCRNTLKLKGETIEGGVDFIFDEDGEFEGMQRCK